MTQFNLEERTVLLISMAISQYEGYFAGSTIPRLNNNPGDLRKWGNLPIRRGFVAFPDPMQGWIALWKQISLNIDRNLTLLEFFAGKPGVYSGYAPEADGNIPLAYANFVSKETGIPINQPLKDFVTGNS